MKRDFKSCMLYAVFGLPIFLLLFIALVYVANCGFSADCSQASLPGIIHTPIPTLIPAVIPKPGESSTGRSFYTVCRLTARSLLSSLGVSRLSRKQQLFQF